MRVIIQKISDSVVKDKPVLFSMLGTLWRVLFAPISLFLIAWKMTPEIQGFYYLFFSIAGLQQIIEAGFSHTLIQSISHEMYHVKFENYRLQGDKEGLHNVREAMKMGSLWYSLVAGFSVFIIYPVGILIMGKEHWDNFDLWFAPWTVFIIIFALNILLYPINFFFEGVLHLEKIYKNRLITQILTSIVFCIFLWAGAGLYVSVVPGMISLVVNVLILLIPNITEFKTFLFKLPSMTYVKKMYKWQLKVSLVWCSGYLYWQFPTVIIFSLLGPVLSGQYSMTANIVNSVMNIGQVFIKTKAALLGKLRAANQFAEAYSLYKRCCKFSYAIIIMGGLGIIAVWLIYPSFKIWERMLPFAQLLVLFIFFTINMVTLNQAMFARCSKEEPFFYIAMFVNFAFPVLLLISLTMFPNTWSIVFSISIIHLIEYIWGCSLFKKYLAKRVFEYKKNAFRNEC